MHKAVICAALALLILTAFGPIDVQAMRSCSFGQYKDGEQCRLKDGTICEFNLYGQEGDMASRWSCHYQGKKLYLKQNAQGQWYLTRPRQWRGR